MGSVFLQRQPRNRTSIRTSLFVMVHDYSTVRDSAIRWYHRACDHVSQLKQCESGRLPVETCDHASQLETTPRSPKRSWRWQQHCTGSGRGGGSVTRDARAIRDNNLKKSEPLSLSPTTVVILQVQLEVARASDSDLSLAACHCQWQ